MKAVDDKIAAESGNVKPLTTTAIQKHLDDFGLHEEFGTYVPRPRPFFNSVAQWIAYQTSNLGVAGSSPVGVVSPIARRPFSIRGRVGLSSTMNQKGVGFKPQSLRRRGFEPHRMHMNAVAATPDGLENLEAMGSTPVSVYRGLDS